MVPGSVARNHRYAGVVLIVAFVQTQGDYSLNSKPQSLQLHAHFVGLVGFGYSPQTPMYLGDGGEC